MLDNVSKNINYFTILLTLTIFINEKTFPTMNQVFIRMSSYFTFYYIILISQLLKSAIKKYSLALNLIFLFVFQSCILKLFYYNFQYINIAFFYLIFNKENETRRQS